MENQTKTFVKKTELIFTTIEIEKQKGLFIKDRYCKPAMTKSKNVKFKNARNLSKEIKIEKNERYFCIIDGSFIFGDFIEAF